MKIGKRYFLSTDNNVDFAVFGREKLQQEE